MPWAVAKDTVREVAQSLQEARKHARTVESTASSLAPLAEGDELELLNSIQARAADISDDLSTLYNTIARRAFGAQP